MNNLPIQKKHLFLQSEFKDSKNNNINIISNEKDIPTFAKKKKKQARIP